MATLRTLLVTISNPATRQIVGRHLNAHAVANQNADTVPAHSSGNRGQDDVITVVEPHFEEGIGLLIDNHALRGN